MLYHVHLAQSHVMTFRYIDTSKLLRPSATYKLVCTLNGPHYRPLSPYGEDELMHLMAIGLWRGGICCGGNRLGVLGLAAMLSSTGPIWRADATGPIWLVDATISLPTCRTLGGAIIILATW